MSFTKSATHCTLALIVFLLAATAAQAQQISSADITLDVRADDSVRQTTILMFAAPTADSTVQYELNDLARDVEVTDSVSLLNHALRRVNGSYVLEILLPGPRSTLEISYTVDGVVFQSDSVKRLFTEFFFEDVVGNMTVSVKLPEGFALYQDSYRPAGAQIGSDGTRIILKWSLQDTQGDVFSVRYNNPTQDNGAVGLVIVLGAIVVALYLYHRKKAREEFFRGFREDEKKTIEFLQARKTALQSDLQKQFGFSRAKATRVVSVLEEKGLVRKQYYGRTNKLYWIETPLKDKIMKRAKG